ncbi:guanylate kinase [Paenibacillus sp. NPDC058174]|uniref:guanylate kinase n=1 Tax=Paenibacillus sp. NPDC058174 TaxID=3346366 RepID=UPI0036D7CF96
MIKLIVFQGPSGSGKTTLQKKFGAPKIITCTTRSPRTTEKNDIDYHFMNRESFELLIKQGKMLEVTQYKSNLYGTLLDSVTNIEDEVKSIVLDYSGAKRVKELLKEKCFRIGVYANKNDCEKRLYKRQHNLEEVSQRMNSYDFEVKALNGCEIIINNSDSYWDNVEWILHSLKEEIQKYN